MRAFWAAELPEDARHGLQAVQRRLRAVLPDGARWVGREQLHLTCRFLGEVPCAAPIAEAVRRLAPPGPVALELRGLGMFGGRRPRVLWAGVGGAGCQALEALVAAMDPVLEPLGIAPRREPFTAHVTLARLGRDAQPVPRRDLAAAVARVAFQPLPFEVRELVLLRSSHGRAPGPARYVRVAGFDLRRGRT